MGVTVEAGRGRKSNFELNLVPFIDLLSVQITFLLATAVWLEVSSLPMEQSVTGESPAAEAPLTLALAATGVDWAALRAALDRDRAARPEARDVVIRAEDGVPYDAFVRALDLAAARGYDRPVIADP